MFIIYHSPSLNLSIQHHLGGNSTGITHSLGHGSVALERGSVCSYFNHFYFYFYLGIAILHQVDSLELSPAVRPPGSTHNCNDI